MQILEMVKQEIQLGKKAAAKRIQMLKEMVKLKNGIAVCKEVAERNYTEIGKAYYEAHQCETENQYGKQICAITNAENGVADLEKKEKLLKEKMLWK